MHHELPGDDVGAIPVIGPQEGILMGSAIPVARSNSAVLDIV